MAIQLAPELERRIESLMADRGYATPELVAEAALHALEDSPDELSDGEMEALLEEGLNSPLIVADDAYWASFNERLGKMRDEHLASKARA
ncbi:hypothetical protein F183_A26580 [Bryobacterales bacterium F-183]|nr:hypothetical protein F183_A26580 [Bryobacterales bacterium F-183]